MAKNTIGATICNLIIKQKYSDDTILIKTMVKHGVTSTSKACIAWYRCKLNKWAVPGFPYSLEGYKAI